MEDLLAQSAAFNWNTREEQMTTERKYADLMYNLSQNLTYDQIEAAKRKDWWYNRQFWQDRFKQLVRQKFAQQYAGVSNPLQKVMNDILQGNKGFNYDISTNREGHSISYSLAHKDYKGVTVPSMISEGVYGYYPGEFPQHSILRALYGQEAMSKSARFGTYIDGPNYSLRNVDAAEVRQVLRKVFNFPDFDIANLTVYT